MPREEGNPSITKTSGLGAARPKFADEIADTIDKRNGDRGFRLRSIRPGGRQRSAEDSDASRRNCGAAQACDRVGEGRHSVILPVTGAESLAYTIRRRIDDRT